VKSDWEPGPDWKWWWREETEDLQYDTVTDTITGRTPKGQCWKNTIERFAHLYELARRHDRESGFPPYMTEGGNDNVEMLRFHLSHIDTSQVVRPRCAPVIGGLELDDRYWGTLDYEWNFAVSLDAATKEFGRLFRAEKERRGPSKKAFGHFGVKSRRPSWRWLEVMDEVDLSNDIPRHNANDRSKLAQALAKATIYHKILVSIIEGT